MNGKDILKDNETESESEGEIDIDDVLEINQIQLTKRELFHYRVIDKFYKGLDIEKVETMIKIVDKKSNISLRLLDWFITKYANKHKIRFDNNNDDIKDKDGDFDHRIDDGFNVHISYKAQLKTYKKEYFDPFRRKRKRKFKYYFDKNKTIMLVTTIGQLNFFRWAFSNNIVNYVDLNFNKISKAMIDTNKNNKVKKNESKITKEKEKDNGKLKLKKKGNSIVEKKKPEKITLSFD
jgi:hypothetical protein